MEKITDQQESFMHLVYEEVERAILEGNPPFAALITDNQNTIIAKTHNQTNSKQISIAHAEIEAIRLACETLGQKKLSGCSIFINAESCAMCAGAIIKSGIARVYYGAPYEEGSNPNIYLREINEKANPKLEIHGGIMQEKFMEQIKRGRGNDKRQTLFNCSPKSIDDINRNFYNTSGDSFDKIPFEPILTDLLLKYTVGNEILEIGSGAGALASWLTEQGCTVACVEPAQELAEKVKAKGLEVYPITIQNFYSDRRYDAIIAISSLIHVSKADFPIQIQKIAKLLKSNGLFFVSLIEGENEGLEDPTGVGKLRYFSKWIESEVDAILSPYFILLENHKIHRKKMNCTFLLRVYSLK